MARKAAPKTKTKPATPTRGSPQAARGRGAVPSGAVPHTSILDGRMKSVIRNALLKRPL